MKLIPSKTRAMLLLLFLSLPLSIQAQDDAPIFALPAPFEATSVRGGSSVLLPSGQLVITNPLVDHVAFLDVRNGSLLHEIRVGDEPGNIALSADGERILVSNIRDASISIIDISDDTPRLQQTIMLNDIIADSIGYPTTIADTGDTLLLTTCADAALVEIAQVAGTLSPEQTTLNACANGITQWGDFVFASQPSAALADDITGHLSLVYAPDARVLATLSLTDAPLLSPTAMAIDTRAALGYIVATRATMTESGSRLFVPELHVIDLSRWRVLRTINLTLASNAAHAPTSIALDPSRTYLYIAYGSSHVVDKLNLNTELSEGRVAVGMNPRDMRLNRDGTLLYVHNALDNTVSVISTRFMALEQTWQTTNQSTDPLLQRGLQLYYSALSPAQNSSCASCHGDYGISPFPNIRDLSESTSTDADDLTAHVRAILGLDADTLNALDIQALIAAMQTLLLVDEP